MTTKHSTDNKYKKEGDKIQENNERLKRLSNFLEQQKLLQKIYEEKSKMLKTAIESTYTEVKSNLQNVNSPNHLASPGFTKKKKMILDKLQSKKENLYQVDFNLNDELHQLAREKFLNNELKSEINLLNLDKSLHTPSELEVEKLKDYELELEMKEDFLKKFDTQTKSIEKENMNFNIYLSKNINNLNYYDSSKIEDKSRNANEVSKAESQNSNRGKEKSVLMKKIDLFAKKQEKKDLRIMDTEGLRKAISIEKNKVKAKTSGNQGLNNSVIIDNRKNKCNMMKLSDNLVTLKKGDLNNTIKKPEKRSNNKPMTTSNLKKVELKVLEPNKFNELNVETKIEGKLKIVDSIFGENLENFESVINNMTSANKKDLIKSLLTCIQAQKKNVNIEPEKELNYKKIISLQDDKIQQLNQTIQSQKQQLKKIANLSSLLNNEN